MFERGIRSDGRTVTFLRRWVDKGTGCGSYWPTTEDPYRSYAEYQNQARLQGCLASYHMGCNGGSEEMDHRASVGVFIDSREGRGFDPPDYICPREIRDPHPLTRYDWWSDWLDGGRPKNPYSDQSIPTNAGMAVVVGFVTVAFCLWILFT